MAMSNSDVTTVLFLLLLLVALAQLPGYFIVKMRQPKVIGEILAGIVLGPGGRLVRLSDSLGLGSATTFGNYSGLLTNPRIMEFALRFEF